MKLDREGRRTVAQFPNALAVAVAATLVLSPLATGTLVFVRFAPRSPDCLPCLPDHWS